MMALKQRETLSKCKRNNIERKSQNRLFCQNFIHRYFKKLYAWQLQQTITIGREIAYEYVDLFDLSLLHIFISH